MKTKLLIINGSRHGALGQSGLISRHLQDFYGIKDFEIDELILLDQKNKKNWHKKLLYADCFIFISGTYWDAWGAPLQYFFEEATPWEATNVWMGKPAAVIISEHSTGAKHVLSTMQGVLNTLGLMVIPLGGVIVSKNNILLRRLLDKNKKSKELEDFWGIDDIAVTMHNLKQTALIAKKLRPSLRSWQCDRKNFSRPWLLQKDFNH